MPQYLWIIRHGDRFDYEIGAFKWSNLGQRLHDPPLSRLGIQQAMETSSEIKKYELANNMKVSRIITSPFLRCIETSNPIANKLELSLLVDHSLFELGQTQEYMPPLSERVIYFPRIDTTYESVFIPSKDEEFPMAPIIRYGNSISQIINKFPGENCIVVTHAAGVVSIISRLLKKPLRNVKPASACCLFLLSRDDESSEWKLEDDYNGSVSHLSEIGNTKPWPRYDEEISHGCSKFVNAGDVTPWL